MFLYWLILPIAAYIIGSIPSGLLVCRISGAPDPRSGGSGNLGATNVARMAGKAAGIITLILDMSKGLLPVLTAQSLGEPWLAAITGLAGFAGHVWPVFLSFKGGKGVATALGVILAFSPAALLTCLAVFVLTYLPWKFVSVGSMCALCSAPVWLAIFGSPIIYMVCASIMALVGIWRHRDNLERLRKGRENRISL